MLRLRIAGWRGLWMQGDSVGSETVGEAIGGRLDLGSGLGCKALLAVSCPELTQLPGSARLNNGGGRVLCRVTACLGFLQKHQAKSSQEKQKQSGNIRFSEPKHAEWAEPQHAACWAGSG